ncbi:hypothetical protein QFC19_005472 [Naganishia cerealis]|uniref:Uncharacterized protein n=1 Tax=Naganishia cerealis TaxID=610337 RepID=A0ACC2VMW9_9TREE|nr:hypothetical protein QFC19_005472 [Naganishia cerealis]
MPIKYVRVADQILDKVQEDQHRIREQNRHSGGGGRGGGGGGGRGGMGGGRGGNGGGFNRGKSSMYSSNKRYLHLTLVITREQVDRIEGEVPEADEVDQGGEEHQVGTGAVAVDSTGHDRLYTGCISLPIDGIPSETSQKWRASDIAILEPTPFNRWSSRSYDGYSQRSYMIDSGGRTNIRFA